MCSEDVRVRLIPVLEKYNLPTVFKADADELLELIAHDKKASGDDVTVVYCEKIGTFDLRKIKVSDMKKYITEIF
jgi:3-dehydroquinate synthetase